MLTFAEFVAENFGGILTKGAHRPGGVACALEAVSQWEGRAWSDDPVSLPDIRPLNDSFADDAARTAAMVRLVEALRLWATATALQRAAFAEALVIATIREIIAEIPTLPVEISTQCRAAMTLAAASGAALAARASLAVAARAAEAVERRAAWEATGAAVAAVAAAKRLAAGASLAVAAGAAGAAVAAREAAWAAGAVAGASEQRAALAARASLAVAARAAEAVERAVGDRVAARACDLWIRSAQELTR